MFTRRSGTTITLRGALPSSARTTLSAASAAASSSSSASAKKSDYRKFSVTGEAARDDTASMHDVISRRFRRHLEEQAEREAAGPRTGQVDAGAEAPERARFAYPPSLVVVDGGPPQVAAASRALRELGRLVRRARVAGYNAYGLPA